LAVKIYSSGWRKVKNRLYIWPINPHFLTIFMIPEEKKAAVKQALQVAFGVSKFDDISLLTEGLSSALIFKITLLDKPYLLRIIMSTDEVADPAHWYDCMTSAANAGLAPRVWYTNTDDRVSITDFVEKRAFPISEARVKLPELLKRLHSLPPFPARLNYLERMDGFVQNFRASKILPESMTDEIFRRYEDIKSVYPRNTDELVSCHNDLKPENMLYDGERPWLVEWEAAFLNDPYMDLSVVANFVVLSDDDEKDYLKTYLGREATEYDHARFFLMRQMLHLFYFTVFMMICARGGKTIDLNLPRPGFREFHDSMWAGQIDLKHEDAKLLYAWVHMEELSHNIQQQRFEDSLSIVADHQML
jgi:thiamine kinase-like enzyme